MRYQFDAFLNYRDLFCVSKRIRTSFKLSAGSILQREQAAMDGDDSDSHIRTSQTHSNRASEMHTC